MADYGSGLLESLSDAQRQLDKSSRAIWDDATRSEAWKKEQIELLTTKEREQWAEKIEKEKNRLADDLRAKRRIAFGAPEIKGADPAVVFADFRAQIEKARQLKSRAEARKMMEDAELIGDEIGAKAAMVRVVELADAKALDDYLNQRPDELEAYMDYLKAHDENEDFQKHVALFGGASRLRMSHPPEELKA